MTDNRPNILSKWHDDDTKKMLSYARAIYRISMARDYVEIVRLAKEIIGRLE